MHLRYPKKYITQHSAVWHLVDNPYSDLVYIGTQRACCALVERYFYPTRGLHVCEVGEQFGVLITGLRSSERMAKFKGKTDMLTQTRFFKETYETPQPSPLLMETDGYTERNL